MHPTYCYYLLQTKTIAGFATQPLTTFILNMANGILTNTLLVCKLYVLFAGLWAHDCASQLAHNISSDLCVVWVHALVW